MKPRLLDLFCGAGGAAVGYARAGFEVVGVDIAPQPRYPFEFVQADALEVLACLNDPDAAEHYEDWLPATKLIHPFHAIHASPPCQAYTNLGNGDHPRLIEPVRGLLQATGLPYVIENIESAPLLDAARLCGSFFGLGVRRHRLFETNWPLMSTPCGHTEQGEIRGYYGRNYGPALVSKDAIQRKGRKPLYRGTVEQGKADMGIDWMTWDELREAIPPAYTELIGAQLLDHLRVAATANRASGEER